MEVLKRFTKRSLLSLQTTTPSQIEELEDKHKREVEELKKQLKEAQDAQKLAIPAEADYEEAKKELSQAKETQEETQCQLKELQEKYNREVEDLEKQLKEARDAEKLAISAGADYDEIKKQLNQARETQEETQSQLKELQGKHKLVVEDFEKQLNEVRDAQKLSTPPGANDGEVKKESSRAKESPKETQRQLKKLQDKHKLAVKDFEKQLKEAYANHKETLDKIDELLIGLSYSERELAQDEIEEEQEREEAWSKKEEKLEASLNLFSTRCDALRRAVNSEDISISQLKQKKEELLLQTRQTIEVAESIQAVYNDRLEFAKEKAKNISSKLLGVREIWRGATEAVTDAKAGYDKWESQVRQLREAMEIEQGVKKKPEQGIKKRAPVSPKRGRGRPRKYPKTT